MELKLVLAFSALRNYIYNYNKMITFFEEFVLIVVTIDTTFFLY